MMPPAGVARRRFLRHWRADGDRRPPGRAAGLVRRHGPLL